MTVSVTPTDLEFVLSEQQTLSPSIPFNVSLQKLTNQSLGFTAGGTVSLAGATHANLQIGLGFAPGLTDAQRFYVMTGPGTASNASVNFNIHQTGINVPATLGYVNVQVAGGQATVTGSAGGTADATLNLALVDPTGTDQKITVDELIGTPAAALGPVTTDAVAGVALPLTGAGVPAGAQISLAYSNLALASSLSVTTLPANPTRATAAAPPAGRPRRL